MLTQIESAVANTILNCFWNHNDSITHMKLQKLYYFFVGRYLAKTNIYMAEHNFQAWPHGPVLPSLYNSLAYYGDSKVRNLIVLNNEKQSYIYKNGDIFDEISSTISDLGNYTAFQLSDKSHVKNGPWYKTFTSEGGHKKDIDKEEIRNFFREHEIA